MGLSHFKSFVNRNYKIYIFEKSKNKNLNLLKKNKLIDKKFFIIKKLPKKKFYFLTISATTSKERFCSIKKFLNSNKTKYLLLEKFCFYTVSEFDKFKKTYDNKNITFINSWGYLVAKKCGIRNTLREFSIVCNVREGNLLGNITHLFHFFLYLNYKTSIKNFLVSNAKKIKNTKRKSYDEFSGTIKLESKNNNVMEIHTKKRMNNLIEFLVLNKKFKINFEIIIKDNNQICLYKCGKEIRKFNFPFSSITTYKLLRNLISKNDTYMPTFSDDYELSKSILKKLKVKIS